MQNLSLFNLNRLNLKFNKIFLSSGTARKFVPALLKADRIVDK